jgi:phosphate transport system substrate-binding protein
MKHDFIAVFSLFAILICTGCKEADTNSVFDKLSSSVIEGLTVHNYPKTDGSTSTEPLNAIIACKLFGIDYKWTGAYNGTRHVEPGLNKNDTGKFLKLFKSSQTHQSFINLIDRRAELILTARKMSPDEKAYANSKGVSLIETPIALDAFIFIVNCNNPIQSLTIKQVQDIYTGAITNWKQVGGDDAEINPYIRNANSGSQELMEIVVMKDLEMIKYPEDSAELLFSMAGALDTVSYDVNSICYTVYYYKEHIAYMYTPKSLAIDGIYPDGNTIGDQSYPYVTEVYAVICSDSDESSMAYKLYEWLQTEAGKQVISESGYVPAKGY